jgi:hypothetical protein
MVQPVLSENKVNGKNLTTEIKMRNFGAIVLATDIRAQAQILKHEKSGFTTAKPKMLIATEKF